MSTLASDLVAPGLWTSPTVLSALWIGIIVAAASAFVGVFVVVRGQAFLGHALGDMGSTGAAGAVLVGAGSLWGFLAAGLVSGTAVDLGSAQNVRERDVTTGIVLGAGVGLAALFLYLVTTGTGEAGATQTILFGSLFTTGAGTLPVVAVLSALAVALVTALYRPLLFATVAPDAARARSVPSRLVGYLFVLAVVMVVEQSALVVGALLSTALLVGPASAAVRMSRTLPGALALAVVLAVAIVGAGIILAYDSYGWASTGVGWPVSFFVTALALVVYVASGWVRPARRPRAAAGAARGAA